MPTSEAALASIPSGTVTFLFTDIEGSTQRWERFALDMNEAIRRHDAIFEKAIAAHGGYVFKKMGDSVCAAFTRASDAVLAALEAQRALDGTDWSQVDGIRVRMAIHSGEAETHGGDYFGANVARVARLLAIANGGQILLSGAAERLARESLAAEIELRALGEHRLKDLSAPESVTQLFAPGIYADARPLRSLDAFPNNLPELTNPLIGRGDLITELTGLLELHRLVTITGAGGVGKTSTALQVAAHCLERTRDGVWYVELAPITNPQIIVSTIARALGIAEVANEAPADTLVERIAGKSMLIVLDNCEHLIAEVAAIVTALLDRCRALTILATSRETLRVRDEHISRMPSLSAPAAGQSLNEQEARAFESIALFDERARSADPQFRLTDGNAAIVGDICRRLDGIPLAIELAAVRVKILPVKALSERIDERFRLVSGGRRSDLPRQQTLYNLIDWSYNLLSPVEKALFERLSVFVDAFSVDSAIDACAGEDLDEFTLLDTLESLVDKSLVASAADDESRRHRLPESTRAFALAKLSERGSEPWHARHAAFALREARRLNREWAGQSTAQWERDIAGSIADVRAALAWALHDHHDDATGIAIVAFMSRFWSDYACVEGKLELEIALKIAEQIELDSDVSAELSLCEAMLAHKFGDLPRQYAAAKNACDAFAADNEPLGAAIAMRSQGIAAAALGDAGEAGRLIETSLERFRELGARRYVSMALFGVAENHRRANAFDRARTVYTEALAIAQESGYDTAVPMFVLNLAEMEFASGNIERAIELNQGLLVRKYHPADTLPALANGNLAGYYAASGRLDASVRAARAALDVALLYDDQRIVALALQYLGSGVLEAEPVIAARILGFVDKRFAEIACARGPTESENYFNAVSVLRAKIGTEQTRNEMEAGSRLHLRDALGLLSL